MELEKRECETINRLWPFWYFFACRPRAVFANPLRDISARAEKTSQNFLGKIDQGLRKIQWEGTSISRIQVDLKWDDSPAVWILLNVVDPTSIYSGIEGLIQSLRNSLGPVVPKDFEHHLIEERFKFVVIVPTVCGKMINSLAWPLRTAFTIASNTSIEKNSWAYIPQELPQTLRIGLGLSLWEHDEIAFANQFSATVSTVALLFSMVSRIEDIPNPTGAGLIRLETFKNARVSELSKLLKIFIDSGKKLLDTFNNLTDDKQRERPYLVEAVRLFSNIYKDVLPSDNFEEQERYVERLQATVQPVELIKFLWIADTLNCAPTFNN